MRSLGDVKPGAVALHDPLVPTRPRGDRSNAIANTRFVYREVSAALAVITGRPSVSATPPACPSPGQLWWDTNDGQLYVWTGSAWVAASCCEPPEAVVVGAAPPASPNAGQLWWSFEDGQLYVWTGSQWVASSCCESSGAVVGTAPPPDPRSGALWWDTVSGDLFVWTGTGWVIAMASGGGGTAPTYGIFTATVPGLVPQPGATTPVDYVLTANGAWQPVSAIFSTDDGTY